MTSLKRSMAGLAGLGLLLAGATLLVPREAAAIYCMPTAFPPANYQHAGTCAPGCDGQLFTKVKGIGPSSYCFIPGHGGGY